MNQSASHHMDTHMNFRVSSDDKKLIETAAQLKGFKPNTYARQKLLESAKKDIDELNHLNTLTLSDKDWNQFLKIMEAPVRINANLKQAIQDFNESEDI